MVDHLTVTRAAEHLSAHFGCDIPVWKVRRVVDSINVEIPRAANYRLIPRAVLDQLAESLRPWLRRVGFWDFVGRYRNWFRTTSPSRENPRFLARAREGRFSRP